ncbi:MAG: PAS domain S-box protein, partial [Myxococcales bacterium]|nr:PAS domain S-box protein [Myxococcales bacterium]
MLTGQPTLDHRITVLVVDDAASDARLVVRLLERAREPAIVAEHAASYEAGMARLAEGAFDVCLVDYDLGDRDGVDFIAEAGRCAPDAPMVLLTGHDAHWVDRRAMHAGAVDFLSKGDLDGASLERTVRYAAERARRYRVEARYRALIEHANDIVALIDADGHLTYLGPSVRRMLGLDPGPRLGRPLRDAVHPDDHTRWDEAVGAVLAHPGRTRAVTFRVRDAEANWRWLDAVLTNRLDEPAVRGVVVTAWDVTERVAQQAQIAFQARLLDSVGQALIATDLDGAVLYWNAAAERLYGWSAAEAVGRSIVDLTTPAPAVEQAEAIMARLARGETWSGEFGVRHRDGREFLALVTNAPFYDANGRLAGIIGASSDVTPFRDTERALQERVKELGALFAASRALQAHDRPLDVRLAEVVALLPAGFQWPARTALRLILDDGRVFAGPGFDASRWQIAVPLLGSAPAGARFEAALTEAPPAEPAFLDEEHHLLRSVGGLVAEAVERGRLTSIHARTVASLNEAVLVVGGAGGPHHVTAANPAVEAIFGYPPGELVGTSPQRLHVSVDVFRRFRDEAHPVLRAGGVFEAAFPMRRRDGSRFAAEQRLCLLDPAKGIEGGVIAVIRDVSQRARAEAELRASEARFREIAEHLDVCFWITSPDKTRMEYVSPAYEQIWGRSADDLYAAPGSWREAILPVDRPRVDEALATQRYGDYALEYRIARPSGEVRWIRDRAFPVRDAAGAVQRVIGIAEDVTDQRHVEGRLQLVTGAISDVISVLDA